ncbi:acyltransferase [Streptomyces sp. NBC_00083]|uniref:acyltransferase family protein n=1 Tax=Streptomyces sp. NBC_00083 TaxID=2975647 RepID=UPI0022528C2E|nr:acyltransferase [Streptomyces sp. NBC_00083]MCX5388030.1 acyltransferase [Streptomyces sp. NBC_00083]
MSRSTRTAVPASARFARLPSLTGMRFFAAFLVFSFHSTLPPYTPFSGGSAEAVTHAVSKAGWLGVGFFFVLSGFVLTWSARPGDRPRQFWRRRLVKIYPNHVVTFVAALVLFAWAKNTWKQELPNLFLLHTWIPDAKTFQSVNPPSWSLSVEIIFYLCFPWLHRMIQRIRPERLWLWVGILTAAVFAVPAIAYAVLPGSPTMPLGFKASVWQYWFVWQLPPFRMLEFAVGILMARIVMTGRWINFPVVPALLLVAVAYVVELRVPWLYGMSAVTLVPVALLIAAMATTDIAGRRSILRNRVCVWLGEVSFAFYLVHDITVHVFVDRFGLSPVHSAPAAAGLLAAEAAISVFFSWLLHIGVELPLMNRFGRTRPPLPRNTATGTGGTEPDNKPVEAARAH